MKSDNPSMLVNNWKKLEIEDKIDFLEYLVSELEKDSKKYNISEYFDIFLLTAFLKTESAGKIKGRENPYLEPFINDAERERAISDKRVSYILGLIANDIVRFHLDWKETFAVGMREPIKAENLFEYCFYKNCIKFENNLIDFIKDRSLIKKGKKE